MKEYIRTRHSVYLLTYHMVFVTKWRKPVITDEIGDFMVATAKRLCDGYGGELICGETDETTSIFLCPCHHLRTSLILSELKDTAFQRGSCTPGIRSDSKKTHLWKCPALVAFVFCGNNGFRFYGCCKAIYRGTAHR